MRLANASKLRIGGGKANGAATMTNDVLMQQNVRGTDSNSLLRLFDKANQIFTNSRWQQERASACKAMAKITKELQRRKIAL
jgi:hypothetical protein